MCTCFKSSSVAIDREFSSRTQEPKDETVSFSVSTHIKDISVRIVHAGGRIEMYQNPIPASKLLQRYPGMCITRPEIFKRPHESLLTANDTLLPGNKYFVIRSSTVEKLKRRHAKKERIKAPVDSDDEPYLTSEEIEDVGNNCCKESFTSAKDFFVSKDRWSSHEVKKRRKEKKRFVPPIQRPRTRRQLDWEPSLTSIQELSP